MKPIAILRDSLREAWDSKLLLVMIVIVAIFLVLVSSVSYTPAPGSQVVEKIGDRLSRNEVYVGKSKAPLPSLQNLSCSISAIETQKEGLRAFDSTYRFNLSVTTAVPAAKAPDDPKVDEPAKPEPKKSTHLTLESLTAAWLEDGSGNFAEFDRQAATGFVTAIRRKVDVSPQQVLDYLAERIQLASTLPVNSIEEVAAEEPNTRRFKVVAGPSKEPKAWPVKLGIFFGAYSPDSPLPLGAVLYISLDLIVNSIGGMLIVVMGIIVTSFFIPNAIRKGAVEVVLSKPIGRWTYLFFKFVGGCSFVFILSSILIGGVWLITGLRSGVWADDFLWTILMLTFAFAMLYAFSVLMAVWTQNSIACILATAGLFAVIWGIGKVYAVGRAIHVQENFVKLAQKQEVPDPPWLQALEISKNVLPRWKDIDSLSGKIVMESVMLQRDREQDEEKAFVKFPSWWGTFGVSAAYMIGFFGLAGWMFHRRDF